MTSLKGDVTGLDTRMTAGFKTVDEQLNAARIRDEEAHGMLKFSLEAREALPEWIDARFDAVEKKQEEEIGLVKDVLRHLTGRQITG